MALNPNRVKAHLDKVIARAREAVDVAPHPRCPYHPDRAAHRVVLTHPAFIIPAARATRVLCDPDLGVLRRGGYTVMEF